MDPVAEWIRKRKKAYEAELTPKRSWEYHESSEDSWSYQDDNYDMSGDEDNYDCIEVPEDTGVSISWFRVRISKEREMKLPECLEEFRDAFESFPTLDGGMFVLAYDGPLEGPMSRDAYVLSEGSIKFLKQGEYSSTEGTVLMVHYGHTHDMPGELHKVKGEEI